mmetsp:Transcript_107872/g.232299  ORF Transcript_107872/g.232299 Transcript_107872/m.232299 type:complete len:314 (+) Transcript_107872:94-1035(+)
MTLTHPNACDSKDACCSHENDEQSAKRLPANCHAFVIRTTVGLRQPHGLEAAIPHVGYGWRQPAKGRDEAACERQGGAQDREISGRVEDQRQVGHSEPHGRQRLCHDVAEDCVAIHGHAVELRAGKDRWPQGFHDLGGVREAGGVRSLVQIDDGAPGRATQFTVGLRVQASVVVNLHNDCHYEERGHDARQAEPGYRSADHRNTPPAVGKPGRFLRAQNVEAVRGVDGVEIRVHALRDGQNVAHSIVRHQSEDTQHLLHARAPRPASPKSSESFLEIGKLFVVEYEGLDPSVQPTLHEPYSDALGHEEWVGED